MNITKTKLREIVEEEVSEGLFGFGKDKKKCAQTRDAYAKELNIASQTGGQMTDKGNKLRQILKKVCEAHRGTIEQLAGTYKNNTLNEESAEEILDTVSDEFASGYWADEFNEPDDWFKAVVTQYKGMFDAEDLYQKLVDDWGLPNIRKSGLSKPKFY